jgi:hypothetical protein
MKLHPPFLSDFTPKRSDGAPSRAKLAASTNLHDNRRHERRA